MKFVRAIAVMIGTIGIVMLSIGIVGLIIGALFVIAVLIGWLAHELGIVLAVFALIIFGWALAAIGEWIDDRAKMKEPIDVEFR